MKIIKHEGDIYIRGDDVIEAIKEHKHLTEENKAISDPKSMEWYSLAHDHIESLIGWEALAADIKDSKNEEVNDAGNHNNSNNMCHISDDLMDQQEEMKIELAKRLLANEAFMNQLMDLTQSLATAVMPVVNSIMNVMAQEIEESLSE